MASNIFTILEYITNDKRKWEELTEEEKNAVNPFMLHRFISMKEEYIDIVNILQKYQNISPKTTYEFYCNVIPKGKTYFKYIKSSSKYNNDNINSVSEYYGCSKREARDYIELLDDEQISTILNEINNISKKTKIKKK
jgi:hypothetical protein